MKNFTLSVATVLAMSTFATAGGDIAPVAEPMVVQETASNSGFYIGGAFSQIDTSIDYDRSYGDIDGYEWGYTGTQDETRNGYMLQAGYQFNEYIAVEGRYWGSSDKYEYEETYMDGWSDSWSDGDITAWGIYVKPMYPVTEAFSVYGLLGYGNTKVDDNWWGYEKLMDEDGFQWGIGASYAFTEHLSFFLDYVQLASDVDGNVDLTQPPYNSGWDWDYANWETSVSTVNFGLTYMF